MEQKNIENITSILKTEENVKKYRPIPFWSWNDKLDAQELRRQIRWMKEQGFGGYFMHARSGLITEYLSDEWFDCVKACVDEGKKLGMGSWAYDENGWPSGFVGGKLLEEEQNRDKYLTFTIGEFDESALVSYRIDGERFERIKTGGQGEYLNVYENTSISTVDILNPEVVDKFIALTHEKYKEHLGEEFVGGIRGFFTDEPQYFRYQQPYTDMIKKYFEEEYGQDILDGLGLLFVEKDGYREFRYRYWKGMQHLLLNSFSKKVYDWCIANGCEFTGHYIEEKTLEFQMMCCAGVMPFYEYETMPGIDDLGRGIDAPAKPKQVSSVASQLGKKQVLTETYAGCGWDMPIKELKRIAEWQYVNGVNIMCHHLLPYSERGQRKRDYPAHYSWVNPWVRKNIKDFNDYFARLGYLLGESEELVRVALFCPIRSVYFDYKRKTLDKGSDINDSYLNLTTKLSAMNVPYHLLDETIMARHAKVENGKLIVGRKSYDCVVFPKTLTMDKSTAELLEEFYRQGGKMLFTESVPEYLEGQPHEYSFKSNVDFESIMRAQEYSVDDINTQVQSTLRVFNGKKFIYAVNLDPEKAIDITFSGDFNSFIKLDLETLKTQSVGRKVHFESGQSFVLFFDDTAVLSSEKAIKEIELSGPYKVVSDSGNYLVLDRIEYSFDGVNYSPKTYYMKLFKQLLEKRYNGELYLKYSFDVNVVPKEIFFLAEDMNNIWCEVNGKKIEFTSASDFDKGVLKADISSLVVKGENYAVIKINYYQSEDVYYALFHPKSTESLVNKLAYNTNIEACYLQGDFGVFPKAGFKKSEGGNAWVGDEFYIAQKNSVITNSILDGYPFFAGEVTLEKEFDFNGKECVLKIDGDYGYAEVFVNGKRAEKSYFDKTVDVTELVQSGKNTLTVTLYTFNRGLFGPHHNVGDEIAWVSSYAYELGAHGESDGAYLFTKSFIKTL